MRDLIDLLFDLTVAMFVYVATTVAFLMLSLLTVALATNFILWVLSW